MLPKTRMHRYMTYFNAPNNNKLRDFFVSKFDCKIIISGKSGCRV